MYRIILSFLVVSFLVGNCFGQQIKYTACGSEDPKDFCKIKAVRILPCKEAGSTKACSLRKGKNYQIQIDYESSKSFKLMNSLPYWESPLGDVKFSGMNDNACDFTQCPVAENVEQTYDFKLKISRNLPSGTFPVKWKIWVGDDKTEITDGCCVAFVLRIA